MDNNITRISDLPSNANSMTTSYSPNIQLQSVQTQPITNSTDNGLSNSYVPINVHANPYGISAQNPIMPHPQQPSAPQKQQYVSEEQLYQMQQQRLPSRDIPQDTTTYSQDEQIQPNYIPRPKTKEDYVRNHEDMTERNLREYEEKNRKERKIDIILTEIQTPIFIAILYLFFQMPIVNTLLFKRFSFLSIYNADGNFNFNGVIFKSIIFGSAYYTVQKMMNFLSDL
jgi:hypothetical protein